MRVKSVNAYAWAVMVALITVSLGITILPGCNSAPAPVVGHPAPDFTLTDLDGNTVRLNDFRGKVVFLNFWATWCPPCRAEMPAMEEVYQEYKDQDVVIIGVDLGESRSSVKNFVEETGYSWTFVVDSTREVARDYMVTGIPSSFFIDKDGVIRALRVGAMSKATMESLLAEAMN